MDTFRIEMTYNKELEYEITDFNGKLMARGLVPGPNNEINSKSWAKGIYFIRINGNGLILIKNYSYFI